MVSSLVFPKALKTGDKVAIISPAGRFEPRNLEAGAAFLQELGLHPVMSENLNAESGYLAGDDNQRADDLNAAIESTEIKGIFCARGGYGSIRLIDRINLRSLKQTPKVFVGFSDITALSMYFLLTCKMVTISAPMMAGTQIGSITPEDGRHYEQLIMNPKYRGTIPGQGRTLISGQAAGPLIGGNLSMLVHCMAAGMMPSLMGGILLIEDVNEAPYRIDRALSTLKISGALDNIAGVVAGQFEGIEHDETDRIVDDVLGSLGVPIITGFPIGHGKTNAAVPIGGRVALDGNTGRIHLLDGAVI